MWTYLKFDGDGEPEDDSPELPHEQTVYLGFDVCRMAMVLGYTERGGCHSILNPDVDDDCNIVAFAPLDEDTPPDMEAIYANGPWRGIEAYTHFRPMPTLLLLKNEMPR